MQTERSMCCNNILTVFPLTAPANVLNSPLTVKLPVFFNIHTCMPWMSCLNVPADCLQVTSAANGSAAECTLVEEEPWKHE